MVEQIITQRVIKLNTGDESEILMNADFFIYPESNGDGYIYGAIPITSTLAPPEAYAYLEILYHD